MKKRFLILFLMFSVLFCGCGNQKNKLDENYICNKEINLEFRFGDRDGIYTGEIDSNGLPNGTGSFSSQNDDGLKWTYYGEWKNGHFNGAGITKFDDGSCETGNYKNDYLDGTCVYNEDDGYSECVNYEDGTEEEVYYSSDWENEESTENDINDNEEKAVDEFYDSLPSAWATSSLDPNAKCVETDDNRLFVYIQTSYDATPEAVSEIKDKVGTAMATYYIAFKNSDINFNEVTILFKDKAGKYLVCFSFQPKDDTYELTDVFGSYENSENVINGLNK